VIETDSIERASSVGGHLILNRVYIRKQKSSIAVKITEPRLKIRGGAVLPPPQAPDTQR